MKSSLCLVHCPVRGHKDLTSDDTTTSALDFLDSQGFSYSLLSWCLTLFICFCLTNIHFHPPFLGANYRIAPFSFHDVALMQKYFLVQSWNCHRFLIFKLLITNMYVLSALVISILCTHSFFRVLNTLQE